MSYVTILDRVPEAVIEALSVPALRLYLARHGWRQRADRGPLAGVYTYYDKGLYSVVVPRRDSAISSAWWCSAITDLVMADDLRSSDVVAELQALASEVSR